MRVAAVRPGSGLSRKFVVDDDGRVVAVPLAWFPRLLAATYEQRALFELSPRGIQWDALDADISIDGLLAGHGDLTNGRLVAPA